MFVIRSIRTRLTLTAALAVALFAIATGTAAADNVTGTSYYFNFGDPTDNGYLGVSTTCDHVRHSGSISLEFQTPRSTPGGLNVYTQVWVKNRTQPWTAALLLDQRQQLVQTVQMVNMAGVNTGWTQLDIPKPILATSFTGSNWNYYDVAVRFWVAKPGAMWSPAFWLAEAQYFEITGSYGYGTLAGSCML